MIYNPLLPKWIMLIDISRNTCVQDSTLYFNEIDENDIISYFLKKEIWIIKIERSKSIPLLQIKYFPNILLMIWYKSIRKKYLSITITEYKIWPSIAKKCLNLIDISIYP